MTEWRAVVGYEGLYEVSDDGQVRSVDKPKRPGRGGQSTKARILRHDTNLRTGHHRVCLTDRSLNPKCKKFMVHRLVLGAFVGPAPDDRPKGLHRDDNPDNNHVSNLYWGTASENGIDRWRNNNREKARMEAEYARGFAAGLAACSSTGGVSGSW